MSVYIKGMDMQTSCFDCPVNKDDGFGYFTCGVTKSECDFLNLPSDCPLLPVPDHGDLIDRDALDADLERQDMRTGEYDAVGFSIDEIENAPTIIPADKEI